MIAAAIGLFLVVRSYGEQLVPTAGEPAAAGAASRTADVLMHVLLGARGDHLARSVAG